MNYMEIKNCGPNDEPMCATSEPGEKLYSRDHIQAISLDISQRILEVFGHHDVPNIVFRLRSTACEVRSVLSGDKLPTVEFLLALHDQTGVSIDWLLTGQGAKFRTAVADASLVAAPQLNEAPMVIPFPSAVLEPIAA